MPQLYNHGNATAQDTGTVRAQHVLIVDESGGLVDFSAAGASSAWSAIHVPAANTQATATKAAAGAGIRNVCTGFTVTLAATSSAPSAVQITVALIDGASAATSYLWRTVIALPATAGAVTAFVRSNCWFPGTANTAMTMEFSAAGGASTVESVSMDGTTTL